MTDYDAMSDEQLAALVAERVMRWDDMVLARERARSWRPAADWAEAGRVLEKMREGGWWCTVVCAPPRSDFGVMVVFAKGAVAARAQCPVEPRAICIAALRAVDA